jgi:DNA-binding NtrC family response regulator
MRLGASDYITKPYEVSKIRAIVRRSAERLDLVAKVSELRERLDASRGLGAMVGVSRSMRTLFGQIERIAKSPVDVLIRGETGTGKELIAREVHARSGRSKGPFVAVNTAAIHESLIESELFGHVKGAFTGATSDRRGFFEQADGGTLFLDEIGDMPMAAQSKVLRALQERVIFPVGTAEPRRVDVRIVSATHQDLAAEIEEKRFRADLYFRIKQVELLAPPLRQRREDILVLAEHFLDRLSARDGRSLTLDSSAVDWLLAHAWPGNVRELEHALSAAWAMADGTSIGARDLPMAIETAVGNASGFAEYAGLPLTEGKTKLVEAFERFAIGQALDASGGNVTMAARQLGIHRQNLQQKMQQLGIRRDGSMDE